MGVTMLCSQKARRLTTMTIVLIALAIAGCPDDTKIAVPDCVGMTETGARIAILNKGLAIGAVTEQFSYTVPDDYVISQNPTGGARVASGAPVALVVSKGPKPVTPPQMVSVSSVLFQMGNPWPLEGYTDERPVHTVTLSAYQIGKYEVTNQQYADVLNWANWQGHIPTAPSTWVDAYGVHLLGLSSSRCQISWTGTEFVTPAFE